MCNKSCCFVDELNEVEIGEEIVIVRPATRHDIANDDETNFTMTMAINDNILFSVHLSQGMIIHSVHVHYANFALIILTL